ncbi:CHAP domain-containing protein [Haloactinopolyspora alba]|uniref:CHAP domain-containing protein n=1 Tax=Haloactinopolyspora alba TaxID=648780 RepID=A0A2P8DVY8_9ACTN|nr:CHAP domain-containing protein [Haloactinopolyspora alba]PSL01364.1 CHAP domain-containing protein [Haloactinopolyspora alba]
MWKKVAVGGVLFFLVAPMLMLAAAFGLVSAAACKSMDDIPFVECEFLLEGGNGDQCQGELPTGLSANVPKPWRPLIGDAAEAFDVNPNFLAAIFLTENGNVWRAPDTDWPTSSAGAGGPMQFVPGTWRDYGIDGGGDGTADRNDPADALHSAASMFSVSPAKGAPIYGSTTVGMPVGSIGKPWLPGTLLHASAMYNAGPGTIANNTRPGDTLDGPEWGRAWEVRRYLHNVHALLHSDLTKSGVTPQNGYTGQAGGRYDHNGDFIAAWADPHGLGVGDGGSRDGPAPDPCAPPTGDLGSVVQIARKEFERGPREQTHCGRICDVYIDDGHEDWCADFVSWVFKAAGVPFKPTPGTKMYFWRHDWQIPAVMGMEEWFRRGAHGSQFFTPGQQDPQPGDVAIYAGHVNIVVAVNPEQQTLVTIGGNESDTIQQSTGTFATGTSSGLVGYGRVAGGAAQEPGE